MEKKKPTNLAIDIAKNTTSTIVKPYLGQGFGAPNGPLESRSFTKDERYKMGKMGKKGKK